MSALGTSGRLENLSERRDLSDAAKALLADRAFGHVYYELRQQWHDELMLLSHDGPMQVELAARLRALDIIPTMLAKLLENYRADLRNARRG
jgi:hypothetical protein